MKEILARPGPRLHVRLCLAEFACGGGWMLYCDFDQGHSGAHSWDVARTRQDLAASSRPQLKKDR